ncbi:MAG TPA: hypothetical protein VFZ48_04640 [Candidatus Saccharimonadales bacterium]
MIGSRLKAALGSASFAKPFQIYLMDHAPQEATSEQLLQLVEACRADFAQKYTSSGEYMLKKTTVSAILYALMPPCSVLNEAQDLNEGAFDGQN